MGARPKLNLIINSDKLLKKYDSTDVTHADLYLIVEVLKAILAERTIPDYPTKSSTKKMAILKLGDLIDRYNSLLCLKEGELELFNITKNEIEEACREIAISVRIEF